MKSQMAQAKFDEARLLLRPLFVTDTVNLQSSAQRSTGVGSVDLPFKFFLNYDFFSGVLNLTIPPFSSKIERPLYEQSLKTFDFKLSDGMKFTQPGDTHFGFLARFPRSRERRW